MFPGLPDTARGRFVPDDSPGSPDLVEAALVAGVAAGDEAAFRTLYRLYRPRLGRFIGLMTARRALVDEAVNDTLLVVWRRSATYNRQCKVSTWIFAIAHRTVLKALRRQDEPAESSGAAETASDAAGPEEQRRRREAQASLRRALAALTPEQRSAVVLTYFHDLPCAEIARIVDCPVETVKTRVFYGRRRLRELLAGEPEDWL